MIERRKALSTQAFWKRQNVDDVARVYKNVFPGIADAQPNKKGNLSLQSFVDVIAEYLKSDNGKEKIVVEAAEGLENKLESVSRKQRDAVNGFIESYGSTTIHGQGNN